MTLSKNTLSDYAALTIAANKPDLFIDAIGPCGNRKFSGWIYVKNDNGRPQAIFYTDPIYVDSTEAMEAMQRVIAEIEYSMN